MLAWGAFEEQSMVEPVQEVTDAEEDIIEIPVG